MSSQNQASYPNASFTLTQLENQLMFNHKVLMKTGMYVDISHFPSEQQRKLLKIRKQFFRKIGAGQQDLRLILSGDVETNPGPVHSKPQNSDSCYNDPSVQKLLRAMERRDDKIKTLIRKLAQSRKIRAQIFDNLKDLKDRLPTQATQEHLTKNFDKLIKFLDNTLPVITTTFNSHTSNNVFKLLEGADCTVSRLENIKEDVIKIVLLMCLLNIFLSYKAYRSAVVTILGFICVYYKIPKMIIDMISELSQPRPITQIDSEEIIYNKYFSLCGKIMFGIMSFFVVKKLPGKQDWDNLLLRLDRVPKAVNGANQIYEMSGKLWNIAFEQLQIQILGKTSEDLKLARGIYNDIDVWADKVQHFVQLQNRDKIDTSEQVKTEVEKLYYDGVGFMKEPYLSNEAKRIVSSLIIPAKALYEYVAQSPIKGGGPRMRPLCMWLIGESGIGKTEMIYPVCIDLLSAMGMIQPKDFHHQIYARQVETEFWDGYKSQKIVIYDDAFQMKDDKMKPNPEIFEVIRSCNTFPQHLHMAALHDKNTFSNAEVMIYTTNQPNVKLESITFPDAFYNRMFENAFIVRPKIEYAIIVEEGGRDVRKLDKTKLNPQTAIDLDCYEFVRVGRGTCSRQIVEVEEPIDYNQFAKLMCEQWKSKREDATRKQDFLNNYAIDRSTKPILSQMNSDSEYEDADDGLQECLDAGMTAKEARLLLGMDLMPVDTPKPSKWSIFLKQINIQRSSFTNYLNSLKVKITEILSNHPYLSALSVIGICVSMFGLYRAFFSETETTEGRCHAELTNSGDSRTLKNQKVKIELASSGDSRTQKNMKPRIELASSGDSKTQKAMKPRVELSFEMEHGHDCKRCGMYYIHYHDFSNPGHKQFAFQCPNEQCEWYHKGENSTGAKLITKDSAENKSTQYADAQGVSDQAAHSLVLDVFRKNTYRMTYQTGDAVKHFGNVTFLQGWVAMMPYHFLNGIVARGLKADDILYLSQTGFENIAQFKVGTILKFSPDGWTTTANVSRIKYADGGNQDCVLMDLSTEMVHCHRSLLKHFVKQSDLGSLTGVVHGNMATFHCDTSGFLARAYQWLTDIRPLDQTIEIYYPEDGRDYGADSYQQRECYIYSAPTQMGDCGSVIGIYSNRLERKIIGMHIAGNGTDYGYATPLTQERIQKALQLLSVKAQFSLEIPSFVDTTKEPKIPEGNFAPVGKSSLRVGQATKTSVVPSRIQGLITQPTTKPSLLKPKIINGKLLDPMLTGLKKCGFTPALLNKTTLSIISNDVRRVINDQYNSNIRIENYRKVLSYEEAVQGTDDEFMSAVNRSTSPGFPYCLNKKLPGKQTWLGSGDFDFSSQKSLELKRDVEALIDDCKHGLVKGMFCVDTLKDERRPIEKVDVGKTRVFSACPQHFVIAFRKYFLGFAAWMYHNRVDNEIAPGVNVYSQDWHRLALRLKSKGKHVIAGDFSNFDGTLNAQILWSIFEDISEWYDDGEENHRIRIGLWTMIVHSLHIFEDNVYQWTHSQPSGNPFTVIINSLYNSYIMRYSWMICTKAHPKLATMAKFNKYVSMISYGDDNVLNISQEVIDIYNQITITEALDSINHFYTDEGKTGEIVKSRVLSEVAFLKRSFVWSEELQRYVAPLNRDVIYEMINWTRNTIDPDEILKSNIETAARELTLHGRDEYLNFRNSINKIKSHFKIQPKIASYEEYLYEIKNNPEELFM